MKEERSDRNFLTKYDDTLQQVRLYFEKTLLPFFETERPKYPGLVHFIDEINTLLRGESLSWQHITGSTSLECIVHCLEIVKRYIQLYYEMKCEALPVNLWDIIYWLDILIRRGYESFSPKNYIPSFVREQHMLLNDSSFNGYLRKRGRVLNGRSKCIAISHAWDYDKTDRRALDFRETWADSFAKNLEKHLALMGFRVILDFKDLGVGIHLPTEMKALIEHDHVLVLITQTYEDKFFNRAGVLDEYNYIKGRIKTMGKETASKMRYLCSFNLCGRKPRIRKFEGPNGFASIDIAREGYAKGLLELEKLFSVNQEEVNTRLLRRFGTFPDVKPMQERLEIDVREYARQNRKRRERKSLYVWLSDNKGGKYIQDDRVCGVKSCFSSAIRDGDVEIDLSSAILEKCDFTEGDFAYTKLKDVSFRGCKLNLADFSHAIDVNPIALSEGEFEELLVDPADDTNVTVREKALRIKKLVSLKERSSRDLQRKQKELEEYRRKIRELEAKKSNSEKSGYSISGSSSLNKM